MHLWIIFSQQFRKGANLEENFDLMETPFFGETSETGKILPKILFLLKISHTAKQSFSGVLKHFPGNLLKTSLWGPENDISESS